MHTDEHLNHWGDRFAASALRGHFTFEQFMDMNPALRARKIYMAEQSEQQAIQRRLEAQVPDLVQRGDQLIEPLHHSGAHASDRPLSRRLRRAMK